MIEVPTEITIADIDKVMEQIIGDKMFNQDEISFISETAKRDLVAVNSKIENLVNELARLGKNLSDIKIVQSKLIGIVDAVEDNSKLQAKYQSRCG